MVERVARALMEARGGCEVIDWRESEWNPAITRVLNEARAAIDAAQIEQMIVAAYVRGAEWNEKNPLGQGYRLKAAFDYADKLLSQDTLHSSSSAEPPSVADAQAGGDHDVLPIGASPSAAQFPE